MHFHSLTNTLCGHQRDHTRSTVAETHRSAATASWDNTAPQPGTPKQQLPNHIRAQKKQKEVAR